jgi:hypothetical protein
MADYNEPAAVGDIIRFDTDAFTAWFEPQFAGTNQVIAYDGTIYTITNLPTADGDILRFNLSTSEAWFEAPASSSGATNQVVSYSGTIYTITNDPAADSDILRFSLSTSEAWFESLGTAALNATEDFDLAGAAGDVQTALDTHTNLPAVDAHSGLGTAAASAVEDFDAAGAAGDVQTALDTHTNLPAVDAHSGLGTAAANATEDFDAAGAAGDVQTALDTHTNLPAVDAHSGLGTAATNSADAFVQKPGDIMTGPLTNNFLIAGNLAEVMTNVAGELTAGNLYYLGNGAWSNADASAEVTSKGMLGVALGTDGAEGVLLCGRASDAAWEFTMGDIIYVSTNAGAITSTRPTGTNHIVRVVGYAINTNEINFHPDRTWIELQ